MGVYLVQKFIRGNMHSDATKPEKVRVENEAAFTLATVKAVITQLKSDQTITQEKLVAAERRADESARKVELLFREIEFGLMIFDAQGFITSANPLVRKFLAVDTWSRRRYGEIFRDVPELAELVQKCFETGEEIRRRTVTVQGREGTNGEVEVSVLPVRDRAGALEIVACIFRDLAPPHANVDVPA
jgi:PAS domain-containing protein